MAWRGLYESWQLAWRLDGNAGRAMQRAVENEAKRTAASALDLAGQAVRAADDDRWGDALGLLQEAGCEAGEVLLTAYWPWFDRRDDGRVA